MIIKLAKQITHINICKSSIKPKLRAYSLKINAGIYEMFGELIMNKKGNSYFYPAYSHPSY